jgi:putative membrane protein
VSPAERTDLAWQRTGLGLLSVSGLLGARALHSRAPALLVAAGVAALIGLAVLGVLTPLRSRLLQGHLRKGDGAAAPGVAAAVTAAVVLVGVAAAVAVLVVPSR